MTDLLVVAGYTGVAVALLAGGVVEGPTRVLLAGALLGFCPGYAVVSALYPVRAAQRRNQPQPGWAERGAIAVGTSLVLLVLGVLPFSVLGFGTGAVLGVVLTVTLAGIAVAAVRRLRVPADERIRLPVRRLYRDAREATVDAPSVDAALNVALAVVVVVGVVTLAVGLAAPDRGVHYSEVALADGADGEWTDTDTFQQGAAASLPLFVENDDDEDHNYTAVVVLERLGDARNNGTAGPAVLERAALSRATVTVPAGEGTTRRIEFTPPLRGSELRLSVYVYVESEPETPGAESADYHLYRWVDVNEGAGSLAGSETVGAAAGN
ncbi:DUF1616 domain-containing protein [Halolamina litorea]